MSHCAAVREVLKIYRRRRRCEIDQRQFGRSIEQRRKLFTWWSSPKRSSVCRKFYRQHMINLRIASYCDTVERDRSAGLPQRVSDRIVSGIKSTTCLNCCHGIGKRRTSQHTGPSRCGHRSYRQRPRDGCRARSSGRQDFKHIKDWRTLVTGPFRRSLWTGPSLSCAEQTNQSITLVSYDPSGYAEIAQRQVQHNPIDIHYNRSGYAVAPRKR